MIRKYTSLNMILKYPYKDEAWRQLSKDNMHWLNTYAYRHFRSIVLICKYK